MSIGLLRQDYYEADNGIVFGCRYYRLNGKEILELIQATSGKANHSVFYFANPKEIKEIYQSANERKPQISHEGGRILLKSTLSPTWSKSKNCEPRKCFRIKFFTGLFSAKSKNYKKAYGEIK